MRSCVFRILFRMYEIFCMNIRRVLYETGEKCGKRRNCGEYRKIMKELEKTNLWRNLLTVCITF